MYFPYNDALALQWNQYHLRDSHQDRIPAKDYAMLIVLFQNVHL